MIAAPPILAQLLRERRRPLATWALALAGVCGMYTSLYPYMAGANLDAMLEALPKGLVEALGYDQIGTAAGYVGSATYGLVALALLLVFAIGRGAAILAGHEESGALELELTSPASRAAIYDQRLAALWLEVVLLVAAVYAVTLAFDLGQELGISIADLSIATLQLALVIGLFGSLALVAGAATGRKGIALGVAAAVAVVSWMFNAIGPTLDLEWMARISPIGWYMADNPVTRGFHPVDALLLVSASALLIALGRRRFLRRDLMT
ncbi:MAG: ABC transporter permease subunit [Nannocystaceae bacterium]